MTFDVEAAKFQSEPRWFVEFTDGASTYRFSDQPIVVIGNFYVDGRVLSASSVSQAVGPVVDGVGPEFALADPDGTVEGYGITAGWQLIVKIGFTSLAYASWQVVGTYRVSGKPRRSGRSITISSVANVLFTMGRLQNMPQIEESDSYIYGTLNTSKNRIGEVLPVKFGRHAADHGASNLIYLGLDTAAQTLVFVACAYDKNEQPTASIAGIYLGGVLLDSWGDFTVATNVSGNYCLWTVSVSIDTAGRIGILDNRTYNNYSRARMFERIDITRSRAKKGPSRPSQEIDSFEIAPVKQLTCNINGPFSAPTDLLDYLWVRHGDGTANRDSSSYSALASKLAKFGVDVVGTITPGDTLLSIANAICSEIGVDQYVTTTGTHAMVWPYSVGYTESSTSFAANALITDHADMLGDPQWSDAAGGHMAPVNRVELRTSTGDEVIEDDAAATTYGASSAAWSYQVIGSDVAMRVITWYKMQTRKVPRSLMSAALPLVGLTHDVGDILRVTARGGPSLAGWSEVPARLLRSVFEPASFTVRDTLIDRSPVENANNAYVAPNAYYEPINIGTCTFTTGSDAVTTTDADAASLLRGDFIQYFYLASTNYFMGRVTNVVMGTPNTIYLNRNSTFSGAVTPVVLRPATAQNCLAGRTSDSRKTNAGIDVYLLQPWTFAVATFPLWEMDGQQPRDAADVAGRQLTIVGAPAVSLAGQFGEALNFNGSSDYVYRNATDADLQVVGELAISLWVYHDTIKLMNYVGCAGQGATADDNFLYQFYANSDGSLVLFWEHTVGANVTVTTSIAGIAVGAKWQFFTVTRGSTGICKFYVGDDDTTPALVYTSGTNTMPDGGALGKLCIGASSRGYSNKLDGRMNGVRIEPAEIGLAQITTLWSSSRRQTASKAA